jgi:hypothetical protein
MSASFEREGLAQLAQLIHDSKGRITSRQLEALIDRHRLSAIVAAVCLHVWICITTSANIEHPSMLSVPRCCRTDDAGSCPVPSFWRR